MVLGSGILFRRVYDMDKVADKKFTNTVSWNLESVIRLWQHARENCCYYNLESRPCAPETVALRTLVGNIQNDFLCWLPFMLLTSDYK